MSGGFIYRFSAFSKLPTLRFSRQFVTTGKNGLMSIITFGVVSMMFYSILYWKFRRTHICYLGGQHFRFYDFGKKLSPHDDVPTNVKMFDAAGGSSAMLEG